MRVSVQDPYKTIKDQAESIEINKIKSRLKAEFEKKELNVFVENYKDDYFKESKNKSEPNKTEISKAVDDHLNTVVFKNLKKNYKNQINEVVNKAVSLQKVEDNKQAFAQLPGFVGESVTQVDLMNKAK